MKRLLSLFLLIALLFFLPFMAYAQSFIIDNLKYEVLPGNENKVSVRSGSKSISGDVSIPSHVTYNGKEYIVDSIPLGAFIQCNSLISLTIPETVTKIGQMFCHGTSIKRFIVSDGNPNYCSVDGVLFSKDMSKLLCFPSSRSSVYTIPESVNYISKGAFILYGNLYLVISKNIKYIENMGIYSTKNLEIVCLPDEPPVCDITDNLRISKLYVYKDCEDKYRSDSFWGSICSNIIASESFDLNLYSDGDFIYELPESGSHATVSIDGTNLNKSIVIPSYVEYKGNVYDIAYIKDFRYREIESVELPETAIEIYDDAFSGTSLSTIVFPTISSLKRIGNNAFYSTDLVTVDLPNSVEFIGLSAFACSFNLKSVKLSDNLKEMSESVFFETPSLERISISPANEYFTVIDNVLYSKDKSILYCYPSNDTKETYYIEDGTDSVASMAFSFVKNLKHVYIPASVTKKLETVFSCNMILSDINVDEDNEFYASADGVLYDKDIKTLYCYPSYNAKDFVIPQGVEKITAYSIMSGAAFLGGETILENIVFPESIKSIGEFALFCNNVNIYTESKIPPTCLAFPFLGYGNANLYVPKGCIDAYRNDKDWGRFSNIYEGKYVSIYTADNNNFSVAIDGRTIILSGVSVLSEIHIYDVSGRLIYSGTSTNINMPGRGCYIIKVEEQSRKILIY